MTKGIARKISIILILLLSSNFLLISQHSDDGDHDGESAHVNACGIEQEDHSEFELGATAVHHISDQNVYSIGPWQIPLPCILFAPGEGFDFFMSSKFNADYHGNGSYAYNGYVLFEGSAKRIVDHNFPDGQVEIGDHNVFTIDEKDELTGKEKPVVYLCHEEQLLKCDSKSTIDGGLLGGGISSFYDFSITKNVTTMLIVFILLGWMFISITKTYKNREGKAPKGLQSLIEPVFLFIQEDVSKPFLGNKWEKFQPFLMALFFFILGLNLFGQIPFFGGSNVTGNLAVTMTLAIFAFIVTNINGNRHYWQHIFSMPGIPGWVKVIVTPVEIIGLFIKPLTLMLRLFGNIVAGHMMIVIFVGLIFVFGRSGELVGASLGTSIGSILLTSFMMAIELLVAFIQAFVFTILTASYIGAATEEQHH